MLIRAKKCSRYGIDFDGNVGGGISSAPAAKSETPVQYDPRALIAKIQDLPANRLAEVEDFIDFIRSREQGQALTRAAAASSERAFVAIWSNPEDDVYDVL